MQNGTIRRKKREKGVEEIFEVIMFEIKKN